MVRDGASQIARIMMADFASRFRGKGHVRIAVLSLCLLFAAATPARPQGTFISFDVPGAGTGILQGTVPVSINAAGDIAGIYLDAFNFPLVHGFVRAANGTITTFNAPHAGTGARQGTLPVSINTAGDIAGMYFDANNAYQGFVRAASGAITEFDVPGASAAGHRGTLAFSINTAGETTGRYSDASGVYHGFVRAANGTIATFNVPGAGTAMGEGTVPVSINTAGDVTGIYIDASGVHHGFIRAADGTMTHPIDPPGAGSGFNQGTGAASINALGDITGLFTNTTPPRHSAFVAAHGFVRAADGTMTTFDAPGVGTGTGLATGTIAVSINTPGEIVGGYSDESGVIHGFLRAVDGTMTAPIDAPGAGTAGAGFLAGTLCASINDWGVITGVYSDTSVVFHGFVLTPAVTFESTVTAISSSLAQGLIDNQGLASALSRQINAASIAAAGGDNKTARKILKAFINQVNAQTGKHINGIAAQVLVADANALLSQL